MTDVGGMGLWEGTLDGPHEIDIVIFPYGLLFFNTDWPEVTFEFYKEFP